MDWDFTSYYKGISNSELLSILDNPEAYMPAAIDAANNEFELRQLSLSEIEEARLPQRTLQLKKEERIVKANLREEKRRKLSEAVFASVKPGDTKEDTINKIILIIVTAYALVFLRSIPFIFRVLSSLFESTDTLLLPKRGIDFQLLLFAVPLLLLPLALYKFWKKKHLGLVLMAIYVTYASTTDLTYMYNAFFRSFSTSYYHLNSMVSAGDYFRLFIHLSCMVVLCRKNMREIYKIEIAKIGGVIFITAIISVFLTL